MILTKPQAKAVYDAMCALNNVDMTLVSKETRLDKTLYVAENYKGGIIVTEMVKGKPELVERYKDQSDFAKAYGVE